MSDILATARAAVIAELPDAEISTDELPETAILWVTRSGITYGLVVYADGGYAVVNEDVIFVQPLREELGFIHGDLPHAVQHLVIHLETAEEGLEEIEDEPVAKCRPETLVIRVDDEEFICVPADEGVQRDYDDRVEWEVRRYPVDHSTAGYGSSATYTWRTIGSCATGEALHDDIAEKLDAEEHELAA